MKKPKLTIELVPRTSWFKNLRSMVEKKKWDFLRRRTYRQADYKCEICGGKGPKHPVECHERWDYNDKKLIQKLIGLIALCPSCHQVKHIGFASIQGKYNQALNHLKKVNGWTTKQAQKYVNDAFRIWEDRSEHKWIVDISWLEEDEQNE